MNIHKFIWFTAGILSLGIAYIGIIIPGIPWSTPAILSAYCFSKSSKRMHDYIYSHKLFGPFLIGWQNKRIFPTKFKYFMLLTMSISCATFWFSTENIKTILGTGLFMILVVIWAWRYPGSEEIYQQRVAAGKRVAWLR